MKKIILFIFIFTFAALLLAGCAPSSSAPVSQAVSSASAAVSAAAATASGQLTLTKDQLAKYNGQNGQPAYVAVDGVIYDVSDLSQWQGGHHNGHTAGTDISSEFKTLPSGMAQQMLRGVPIVGKLVG